MQGEAPPVGGFANRLKDWRGSAEANERPTGYRPNRLSHTKGHLVQRFGKENASELIIYVG